MLVLNLSSLSIVNMVCVPGTRCTTEMGLPFFSVLKVIRNSQYEPIIMSLHGQSMNYISMKNKASLYIGVMQFHPLHFGQTQPSLVNCTGVSGRWLN